jgi:hypothetical protein
VFEYSLLLSKPSISGNGHSSGYGSGICKIAFNVYNFLKNMCLNENEAEWISVNART